MALIQAIYSIVSQRLCCDPHVGRKRFFGVVSHNVSYEFVTKVCDFKNIGVQKKVWETLISSSRVCIYFFNVKKSELQKFPKFFNFHIHYGSILYTCAHNGHGFRRICWHCSTPSASHSGSNSCWNTSWGKGSCSSSDRIIQSFCSHFIFSIRDGTSVPEKLCRRFFFFLKSVPCFSGTSSIKFSPKFYRLFAEELRK